MKECAYCGAMNYDDELECHACGAPNKDAKEVEDDGAIERVKRDRLKWIRPYSARKFFDEMYVTNRIYFYDTNDNKVAEFDFPDSRDPNADATRCDDDDWYVYMENLGTFDPKILREENYRDVVIDMMAKLRVDVTHLIRPR